MKTLRIKCAKKGCRSYAVFIVTSPELLRQMVGGKGPDDSDMLQFPIGFCGTDHLSQFFVLIPRPILGDYWKRPWLGGTVEQHFAKTGMWVYDKKHDSWINVAADNPKLKKLVRESVVLSTGTITRPATKEECKKKTRRIPVNA